MLYPPFCLRTLISGHHLGSLCGTQSPCPEKFKAQWNVLKHCVRAESCSPEILFQFLTYRICEHSDMALAVATEVSTAIEGRQTNLTSSQSFS